MTLPSNIINIKSYPQRFVNVFPIPFWLSWILIWLIIYVVDLYLSVGSASTHSHLTELGVAVFCASVAINLAFSSRVMTNLYQDLALFVEEEEEKLTAWYSQKLRQMYTGPWPLIASVLFVLLVELTVGKTINSFNQHNEALLYFRMGYRIIGFFLLGLSLWATFSYMRLPGQLLRFKFRLRLSNLSGIGLHALGTAFFKLALFGIVSFIFLVFTIMVSPIRNDQIILIWVAIGATFIFCLFLIPQLGVHNIMATEKRQQLISFSNHLEQALAQSIKDPSQENMQRLRDMLDLQNYLKGLNDWPFNTSTLWQLISALLVPLALVILQIVFKL